MAKSSVRKAQGWRSGRGSPAALGHAAGVSLASPGWPVLLTVDHLLPIDLLLRQVGHQLPADRVLPVLGVQLGFQVGKLALLVLQEMGQERIHAEPQVGRLDAPGRVKGGGGSTLQPPASSQPTPRRSQYSQYLPGPYFGLNPGPSAQEVQASDS